VPKKYGNIKEEEKLQQSIIARDIVKTVLDYGVSQYQIQKIIYLLTLELEDRNLMDDIQRFLKPILDADSEQNRQGLITT